MNAREKLEWQCQDGWGVDVCVYCALLILLLTCSSSVFAQSPFYYAVENLDTGAVVSRGVTTAAGIPAGGLILAPQTNYREWLFEASSGFVGFGDFRTPESGRTFVVPAIRLRPPVTPDSDGDALSDDAEFILGTNPLNPDSDGDGVKDGAAIALGLDPGAASRTGIVAGVDTPGAAVDVAARDDLAVVADSRGGVAVFNIFNRMSPLIIAQAETWDAARDHPTAGDHRSVRSTRRAAYSLSGGRGGGSAVAWPDR